MASTSTATALTSTTGLPPHQLKAASPSVNEAESSGTVEMSTLQSPPASSIGATAETTTSQALTTHDASQDQAEVPKTQSTEERVSESNPGTSDSVSRPKELTRAETEAIGPSSDNPSVKADPAAGPAVIITLLLTTGARHPYKIDEKYLRKRNVNIEQMDPFNISVYTLKELIWRDWREEWEPRPTSPSYIRLIHFGRMLDDKSPLKDCRFQQAAPNVVHMTVKPQELMDEDDGKTGKGTGRDRDDSERTAGCRCVIL